MDYDVIIIGAGPGGIYAAYELMQKNKNLRTAVFESGHPLDKRRSVIHGNLWRRNGKNAFMERKLT